MPTKRTNALLKTGLVLLMAWTVVPALAQTRYWTGGHGDWSDADHWSLTSGGPGGAGAPRATDDAVIEGPVRVRIQGNATCKDLDVRSAEVRVEGAASAELVVAGSMTLPVGAQWSYQGRTRFTVRRQGVELHLRGVRMHGDLVFEGTGTWSLLSDLVVDGQDVVLKEGTLITNGNLLQARALEFEGRGTKRLIAGRSIVMLSELPSMAMARQVVEPGASVLSVNGQPVAWDVPPVGDAQSDRDINVCGTGPGQKIGRAHV